MKLTTEQFNKYLTAALNDANHSNITATRNALANSEIMVKIYNLAVISETVSGKADVTQMTFAIVFEAGRIAGEATALALMTERVANEQS